MKISCGTQEIPLGEPFDRMLHDTAQMRERNAEVPVLELVQFGADFGESYQLFRF